MLDKIKIVLFRPRFIGFYIKENILLLIAKLLLCTLIVLLPSFYTIGKTNEISSEFRSYLIETTNKTNMEDVKLIDNILYFDNEYEIDCYYFTLIIGENNSNLISSLSNKLVFNNDGITFYASSLEVYSETYENLNIPDIDFSLISTNNVMESNKFISIFNKLYQENNVSISIYFSVALLIDMLINVFGIAAMLAIISMIFSKGKTNIMPFAFRYKMCLNAQYVYLLLILLGTLFGVSYISYIATFVMSLYAFIAMSSITMVKKG